MSVFCLGRPSSTPTRRHGKRHVLGKCTCWSLGVGCRRRWGLELVEWVEIGSTSHPPPSPSLALLGPALLPSDTPSPVLAQGLGGAHGAAHQSNHQQPTQRRSLRPV